MDASTQHCLLQGCWWAGAAHLVSLQLDSLLETLDISNDKHGVTRHRSQVTGQEPQVVNHISRVTSHKPWVTQQNTSHKPHFTTHMNSHRSQATIHTSCSVVSDLSQVNSDLLQVTSDMLQVTSDMFQVPCDMLQVTSWWSELFMLCKFIGQVRGGADRIHQGPTLWPP